MIWLVEWRKIIVLHVRHAFWCIVLTQSAKRRLEIFIFEVLMITRARSSKSFTLCLYMKTIRTKLAEVQFAYFVQRDQHGIIAKDLTQSSILMWRFRCSCRRSFLNSLFSIFTPTAPLQVHLQRILSTIKVRRGSDNHKIVTISQMIIFE